MPDDTTPRNQAQPPAIPGPQAGQDDSLPRNEADYQRLLAEMEARYSGSSLPPETALKFLLDDDETTWCHPEALALLAMFRHDPIMWLSITTYAHKRYVSTRLLTAAVDAHMAEQTPQRQPATPATSTADQLPYSDYTNALALVRAHGANLRYCYPWK